MPNTGFCFLYPPVLLTFSDVLYSNSSFSAPHDCSRVPAILHPLPSQLYLHASSLHWQFQPPSHFPFRFSFFCLCLIFVRRITIQKKQDGGVRQVLKCWFDTTAANFIALLLLLFLFIYSSIVTLQNFLCHLNRNCPLFPTKDCQCTQEKFKN